MLRVAVVLVVVVSVVEGEVICAPNQWEGIQVVLTGTEEAGTSTLIQSTTRFSFDANNTRIAASTSGSRNGVGFQKDFLFLYQTGRVYIIDDGRCRATLLQHFPSPCLPRTFNSTWGMMWDGFVTSTDKLFMFEFMGGLSDLYCHVRVLAYTKVPVYMEQTGTVDQVPVFRTTAYTNSTLGIKNPDVFTLPSICKTAKVEGTFDAPDYFIGLNFE